MKRLIAVSVLALCVGVFGCHDNKKKKSHAAKSTKLQHSPALTPAPEMKTVPTKAPVPALMTAPGTAAPAVNPATLVTAGAPMTVTTAPVPVSEVLANPEKYAAQPIKIEGTVSSVCVKKGCWARLTDASTPAGKDLFVKFDCPEADDGRVLPLSVKGNQALVEGTVKVTEMSEAKARHYAKDAGLPEAEVNKIVGPQKQVTVASPSVQVTMK